jgi:pyruvate dehydrogenase E2 component (dihydrolipoamide acetyltransferase)
MRYEFKLPDLAEGMVEGELVGWLIEPGNVIKAEQPVAEVMTDKATVVIPSPVDGTVTELCWQVGDIVPVGAVLYVMDATGEVPEQRALASHVAPDAPAQDTPSAAVPSGPAPEAAAAPVQEVATAAAPVAGVPRGAGKALATPATRRLARELGIDIGEVSGTGPAGRVTAEDVTRHAQRGAAPQVAVVQAAMPVAAVVAEKAAPAAPTWTPAPRSDAAVEGEERVKIRGLRRAIYETMARSKATAAHFTYVDEVDCEALVRARELLAVRAKEGGVKFTYLAMIAKAVTLTLARFPKMNAQVDDRASEIVLKKHVHLGIAVATDAGLVVPVIKHAHRMTMLELAWHIADLSERARQNKLKPDELKGSTFTITSLGKLGGLFATPVINHPEVGILGIHQMQKRAVVMPDDSIVPRQRMNISLSFDHRVIDGHEGAAFAIAVKSYLEQPETMLLEMA